MRAIAGSCGGRVSAPNRNPADISRGARNTQYDPERNHNMFLAEPLAGPLCQKSMQDPMQARIKVVAES